MIIISKYKDSGWKLLNKNMVSTLGGSVLYWTYDKCKECALKYKHRKDFKLKSGGAYSSARNNNWLNDICSHMEYNKPKRWWSDIEIDFLINNYDKGIKYCSEKLNRSYYSVKSQYHKLKK